MMREIVNPVGLFYVGHARAGIQILLDNLAPGRANATEEQIGLRNSYLFLEAKNFSAKQNNIELGGTSYLLGLLFEF